MDIDAIAKEMPRFKRIADHMERMLADPFVAGTAAERADALADLQALREFRDKLPEVESKLGSVEAMIQDVAELKNRPVFDPSQIPQPSDNPSVTEDRVKALISEAMSSTSIPASSTTAAPVDQSEEVDTLAARLNELETKFDGLPAAGAAATDLSDALKSRDDEIAALKDTVAGQDARIAELSGTIDGFSTKLDALMDALDVQEPDLGAAGAGDGATEADLNNDASKDPAAPDAPQGVQDPA